jgi:hypothetical protein
MSAGIDVSTEDLDVLVSAAADYAKLVTATTITLNQGGLGGFRGLTAAQITTLAARYFAARRGESKTGI